MQLAGIQVKITKVRSKRNTDDAVMIEGERPSKRRRTNPNNERCQELSVERWGGPPPVNYACVGVECVFALGDCL